MERSLFFQQLAGQQGMEDLDVRYAFSQANREEPDRRETRYDYEPGNAFMVSLRSPEEKSIFIVHCTTSIMTGMFSSLVDFHSQNQRKVFLIWPRRNDKRSKLDTRRYKSCTKVECRMGRCCLKHRKYFFNENIGSTGFQFEEVTRQTDNTKQIRQ